MPTPRQSKAWLKYGAQYLTPDPEAVMGPRCARCGELLMGVAGGFCKPCAKREADTLKHRAMRDRWAAQEGRVIVRRKCSLCGGDTHEKCRCPLEGLRLAKAKKRAEKAAIRKKENDEAKAKGEAFLDKKDPFVKAMMDWEV